MNGNMIKLENLHIGYFQTPAMGKHIVYGPLNKDIQPADMIGIIGRNGIGKSTLLRTLAGLQPHLSGKIFINDVESSRISRKDMSRLISYVSTEVITIQNLNVSELVAMGRFPHTGWLGKLTKEDIRIINESINLTGVMHLAHKSVYQLSDGERQRVMIARALAQDTPVIILDEPTAFLDLPARYEILRLLSDLTRNNRKTILFSTHDLSIAMDEADKLWLMTDNGLFDGAPEDLLINQLFRNLYINSQVEFDPVSSSFRCKRLLNRYIRIQGEKEYCSLTLKALERLGYRADVANKAEFEIIIRTTNNIPVWYMSKAERNISFSSIYELTSYLKKYSEPIKI
jgi:iron complex transport system ATP-binding protein